MKKALYLICCALSMSALCSTVAQGQTISTVAGGGTGFSFPPEPATTATLTTPYGIVCDGAGNLYITEEGGGGFGSYSSIQEVSAGTLSSVAGTFSFGPPVLGDGGPATAATLSTAVDVAVDAAGNLYIADNGNYRVRMVNASTGIITTIAGNGSTGAPYGDGGPATAAHINPRGIVASTTGDTIYVSDGYQSMGGGPPTTNYAVRILIGSSVTGVYTINDYAGTGAAGTPPYGDGGAAIAANLNAPRGLFLDAAGNLYIADMSHNRIREVNAATGNISTVAGNGISGFAGDGAAATAAKLSGPTDVVVDPAGDMYIADANNNRVRYVDNATGNISTIVDATGATGATPYGDGGAAVAANLSAPVSIALDPLIPGNYYVSDQTHNLIRYVNVFSVANTAPTFVHTGTQTLTVCENSGAASINTQLSINDPDVGQTESWSTVVGPAHGTLAATYSTTSTGSTLTPTGLTYTPNIGYSGTDAFRVQVNDGTATATTTVNVTVTPLPTIAAIGGPTAVCSGASIVLTETTTGGSWAAANTDASVVGGTVTGNVAGADNIYYYATNSCGTDSATVVVDVNTSAIPTVAVSSSLGTTTCSVPGTFTAIPTNGGPTPTYQWSVNSGVVPGATSAAYTYTPVTGDVVSVVMTSSAPCVSPATATGSITMSGGSSIVPTINIASGIGTDTFCVGVPITFTSAITNGGTAPSYIWTVGGATLGFGSTFTYTPTVASAGSIVEATLTSSIACAVPSTVVSNDITINLRLATASSIAIAAHPGNTVCAGTNVTFTSAETGGGSSPSYRWTKAGVNVATGPSYTTVPGDGDVVYCTMHSSISCSPSDSVLSNLITMTTAVPVTPVVTIVSSSLLTSVGHNVIFSATVTSATVSPSYQWYVNGVLIPGAIYSVYTLIDNTAGNAVVNCAVTSGDACNVVGMSNFISVIVAGVGVPQLSSTSDEMKLFPNPNEGIFTMTLLSANDEPVSVVVTNILGQKVAELTTATNTPLDIKIDAAPGIYLLSATAGQGRYVAKVMIN